MTMGVFPLTSAKVVLYFGLAKQIKGKVKKNATPIKMWQTQGKSLFIV
jgi:hypothetical protein